MTTLNWLPAPKDIRQQFSVGKKSLYATVEKVIFSDGNYAEELQMTVVVSSDLIIFHFFKDAVRLYDVISIVYIRYNNYGIAAGQSKVEDFLLVNETNDNWLFSRAFINAGFECSEG